MMQQLVWFDVVVVVGQIKIDAMIVVIDAVIVVLLHDDDDDYDDGD